jgi:Lipocalin-like domain
MLDEAQERLVGVWRLESYQDRPSVEDEWEDTYGADVDGLIVYDTSDWLSIQVAGSDGRYDSYFGRCTITEANAQDGAIMGVVSASTGRRFHPRPAHRR